jgi:hypothetical protein
LGIVTQTDSSPYAIEPGDAPSGAEPAMLRVAESTDTTALAPILVWALVLRERRGLP